MTPRGWTWLPLLLAVPVLYVLTLPPIAIKGMRPTYAGGGYEFECPPWLQIYMRPYEWLEASGATGGLLTQYSFWWMKRTSSPGPPSSPVGPLPAAPSSPDPFS